MNLLKVSPSPHLHDNTSVSKLMYGVLFALLPALVVSVIYFGWGAIIVTSVSVLSCVLFEFLFQKYLIKGKTTIFDGSAILTGLLLAFNIPSNLPLWMIIVGALVAIGVAKMTFGGLGNNPFNPALVARVFMLMSFPVHMTSWPKPMGFATKYVDAITGPTTLGLMKTEVAKGEMVSDVVSKLPSLEQLFYGSVGGSMGEVAAIALLLGLTYMLAKKIITWHIPVSIIGTVLAFTGILWLINPQVHFNPMYHLLSGGLLLGAIFMATDYVTSPMSHKGMLIFGVGIGVITVLIRVWGIYPEGISFAILIMNAVVPLINKYVKPKRFGEVVNNGK